MAGICPAKREHRSLRDGARQARGRVARHAENRAPICGRVPLSRLQNEKDEGTLVSDNLELELKNIEFPIKAFHVTENKGIARFTQDSEKIHTEVKEAEPGSLAVMFFKNLSNDEEQEYFCEGFSEDLLSMLSRFNKLVVISSHASFAYKEKTKSFIEIGKELGVRYIIHGSVRKLGPKMRINANLVSTENENSIWSNNFYSPI